MSKPGAALRAAGWVTVGVVAAGGVGVAAAASDGGSSKTATTTAATAPAPAASSSAAGKGKRAERRKELRARLGGRVLHGQATVLGKDDKPVVVAEQRGTVDAVSATSITLTSTDGFKQTYVVTADTHVRVDGKKSAISSVKPGDTAGVLAKVSGSTQTASLVIERPAKSGTTS